MATVNYWGRRVLTLLVIPLVCTIGILAFAPTDVAFAQDDAQVSGTIYHDVVGAANPADFTTFATPAKVSLFKGSTYITTTTTDASGHYTFTGLAGSSSGLTYVIAVDNIDELSGFSDGEGMGAVEQTWASSGNTPDHGAICAGTVGSNPYAQQTSTNVNFWREDTQNGLLTGPCYGGRAVTINHGTGSVSERRYVTKIEIVTSAVITGVDFAFSHNVVTNLNPNGPGSLRMFIRAANALSDTHTMRFVPLTAPNIDLGTGKEWWRLSVTGTATLPTITGNNIVIDGTPYFYRTGAVNDTNTGNVAAATTAGISAYPIAAVHRPELELWDSLSVNEATLEVQGNNVTIRDLAFRNELPGSASYHIRQSDGISLTVEDVVMGYDMETNGISPSRTLFGIQAAYATPTTGSGTFRHNYIATTLASILLSNSTSDPGNVVAATLGDWTIEENVLIGGIRLGAGTDRILIRHNKSDEAIIMAQSPGVNTAVGNNTITDNTITSATGDSIRLYESDNNVVTFNLLYLTA